MINNKLKYFLTLLIVFVMQAAQLSATTAEVPAFSTGEGIRSNDILSSPQAKVPSPEVTIYFPRVDFATSKSSGNQSNKNLFFKNLFFVFSLRESSELNFCNSVSSHILFNVFRI